MAFSAEFRAHVEECLVAILPIRTKPMFGGVGIYSADLFFALIAGEKLYLKVSDLNRSDFEAARMEPFFPFDSPTPMGYWELPPGLLENAVQLEPWLAKALEVASQSKRGAKRKRES